MTLPLEKDESIERAISVLEDTNAQIRATGNLLITKGSRLTTVDFEQLPVIGDEASQLLYLSELVFLIWENRDPLILKDELFINFDVLPLHLYVLSQAKEIASKIGSGLDPAEEKIITAWVSEFRRLQTKGLPKEEFAALSKSLEETSFNNSDVNMGHRLAAAFLMGVFPNLAHFTAETINDPSHIFVLNLIGTLAQQRAIALLGDNADRLPEFFEDQHSLHGPIKNM